MTGSRKVEQPPSPPVSWFRWVWPLAGAALTISAYLLWHSLTGERLPGCGPASGCGAVLSSRWAYFLGVPVSLFAILAYLLVLAAAVWLRRSAPGTRPARLWSVLMVAAVSLLGAAAWFVALQLFVIKAICPFCMAAHTCGAILGGLILAHIPAAAPHEPGGQPSDKALGLAPASVARCALLGLAAVGILAAGQLAFRPRSYAVQTMTNAVVITTRLLPTGAVAALPLTATISLTGPLAGAAPATNPPLATNLQTLAQPAAKAEHLLQLHGGAFTLNLEEVPILGSPAAPHVIVDLFDYSCPHCRQLHPMLLEAYRRLSNQLAIVSLVVPLATNCNPILKAPIPLHTNACEYARIGLAVWRADRSKLAAFDDWVFTPTRPAMPAEVEAEAKRLVGTNAYEAAVKELWIKQQIDLGVRLYSTNYALYHRGILPEVMVGTEMVSGVPPNVGVLCDFLSRKLGIELPQQ